MPNSRQHAKLHAHTHAQTRTRERRQHLAFEAARLMAEGGIRDYHQAKLKAAQRLGIHDDASLPRNREIEDALREYQRLFLGSDQAAEVRRRREAAQRARAGAGDLSLPPGDHAAYADDQPPRQRLVLREVQQRREAEIEQVTREDLDPRGQPALVARGQECR